MRLQAFRSSAAVASFFKRWKLSVYFSLRFQVGCKRAHFTRHVAVTLPIQGRSDRTAEPVLRLTQPHGQRIVSVAILQQQIESTYSQLQRDCSWCAGHCHGSRHRSHSQHAAARRRKCPQPPSPSSPTTSRASAELGEVGGLSARFQSGTCITMTHLHVPWPACAC